MTEIYLKKSLGAAEGVALAFCTIVGSGILGLPGISLEFSDANCSLIGWFIVIIMSIPLVILFYNVSSTTNSASGVADYISSSLGDRVGGGITYVILTTFMLCIPTGTFMGAMYIKEITGIPIQSYLVASFLIIVSSTILACGIRQASFFNYCSVGFLVVLICAITASNSESVSVGIELARNLKVKDVFGNLEGVLLSVSILFWAILGWENVTFSSEELRQDKHSVILVYGFAFFLVSALYILLSLVSSGAYALDMDVGGVTGLLNIIEFSKTSNVILYTMICFIVLANINAWVYASSRMLFSSSRNSYLPKKLCKLYRDQPLTSIATQALIFLAIFSLYGNEYLSIKTSIQIANVNFGLAYLLTILSYFAKNRTIVSFLVSALALFSCAFLFTSSIDVIGVSIAIFLTGMAFSNLHFSKHPHNKTPA